MSLPRYDRFVDRCDPASREYALLKNGVIVRRPKQDHFERIVEIQCALDEAQALLDSQRRFIRVPARISKKLSLRHAIHRLLPNRIDPLIRIRRSID
jgi:hypothetical protein